MQMYIESVSEKLDRYEVASEDDGEQDEIGEGILCF